MNSEIPNPLQGREYLER